MIRLGKLTDYAVLVMGYLAREEGGFLRSAPYLAGKTGVPEPTVAKVLKTLSQAGLLESSRGADGGYRLSRPASQISVADIITALEGPIAIVTCFESDGGNCKLESGCPIKDNWMPVNDAIRAALESVKLPDMMASSYQKPDAFINISTKGMELQ